ncbi:MAG: hypothetical protein ACTSVV_16430 [Promethearchaeota archaeon]
MIKRVRSRIYNYDFNFNTGLFIRWGRSLRDDPLFSPFGPEILDLEISTICSGINGKLCPWCYKSNTHNGENMSFETFKIIFHKLPKNLTQIAFGIGDIDSNPDLFKILNYCQNNSYNRVIPNITVNGWNITDKYADKLAKYCGAVAVSNYDKDICYNAVQKLINRIGKRGYFLKQVNIHQLTALETFESCKEVIRDKIRVPRLKNLNAIIFLSIKNKGRGIRFHSLSEDKFKEIIEFSLNHNIPIGMDSCSAYKFLRSIKDHKNFQQFKTLVEPCESGLFSLYINVNGISYFCSFLEGEPDIYSFNILECQNFLKDVWYHPKMIEWRKKLLHTSKSNDLNCRECPHFKI